MRENPFLCRVYICNKRVEVEKFSTSYFIYGKGEGKRGCLRGKDFLFMMASILPVSLFRRNNQGII